MTANDIASAKGGLSRRGFLQRSAGGFAAAVAITSTGALLNASEAWALDVKGLKPETMKTLIVGALDAKAGQGGYVGLGWEADRVDLLKGQSANPMFETIRSGLVASLYNQPDVWPIFGYEGESFSKGGYIHRGFDDITWL